MLRAASGHPLSHLGVLAGRSIPVVSIKGLGAATQMANECYNVSD